MSKEVTLEAYKDELRRLCDGGRWRMSIPARVGRDSDLTIDGYVASLTAERDRARDLAARLEAELAQVRGLVDRWQWGGWADALLPQPVNVIGQAQAVTEWFRAQLAKIEAGEPR